MINEDSVDDSSGSGGDDLDSSGSISVPTEGELLVNYSTIRFQKFRYKTWTAYNDTVAATNTNDDFYNNNGDKDKFLEDERLQRNKNW